MSTRSATIANPSIDMIEMAERLRADTSTTLSAALRRHLAPRNASNRGNFNSFIEDSAANKGNFNSFI
ncbi:hypothetical protein GV792_05820 [Nocardia cyriacigeorgica]|nr:hypothetical protein [Nocardia cyriacigeorgica]NEW49563.1 hypothetical protein [Nocardia cyriacigeorgica]